MNATERSVIHHTFSIERTYPVSPERVFQAFADPAIKARWFVSPEGWTTTESTMDFRVGGRETNIGSPPDGMVIAYDARYMDIVANQHIVFTHEILMDGKRLSVSVATIELMPEGSGTRFIHTEQGAYLDGLDTGEQREEGTLELMKLLEAVIAEMD